MNYPSVNANNIRCFAAQQGILLRQYRSYGIECDYEAIENSMKLGFIYAWILDTGCEIPNELYSRICRYYSKYIEGNVITPIQNIEVIQCNISMNEVQPIACPVITINEI